jgi:hypothetical protein
MNRILRGITVCAAIVAVSSVFSQSFGADTHVIIGTQQRTWTYNGHTSVINPPTPLIVDDLKPGDIIELQVPGSIPHGFIPIKTQSGQSPVQTTEAVLACGDPENAKPNAVLRELDCGPTSKIGIRLNNGAKLRLEVLDKFSDEVDFWCVVHLGQMLGSLKLKQ